MHLLGSIREQGCLDLKEVTVQVLGAGAELAEVEVVVVTVSGHVEVVL